MRAMAVEGARDLHAVRDALDQLDLLEMADRVLSTLSGGERQRVLLARALAQQQVLELVEMLRKQRNLAVISTLHNLTLAGQYADRLVLLDRGRVVQEGTAAQVLTEANISRYYGAPVRIIDDGGRPVVLPVRTDSC